MNPDVCRYVANGFGPTLLMVALGLAYIGLSLAIQRRLRHDTAELGVARGLDVRRRTLTFLSYMFVGEIRNPRTRRLRAINLAIIAIFIATAAWGIWSYSVAPGAGCFLS